MKTATDKLVRQQAAEFVVRSFSGNATVDDELELEAWLAADERHRVEYRQVLDTWDQVAVLYGEFTDDGDHASKRLWGKGLAAWQPWTAVASLALVALVFGFWAAWHNDGRDARFSRYATAVGEQRTVALPDGSTVELNTDTRLIVDYSAGYRHLILDKGEAFFDVAKDRHRPFTVNSGAQSVTALGTKFNVKRIETELTVAVVEGVVAVHQARDLEGVADIIAGQAVPGGMATQDVEGQYRLEAGAVAMFTGVSQAVTQTEMPDIERIHSWREGLLRFDGERLEHVVSEFERYMVRDIEIDAPATGDLKISGVFRLDDEEGIWRGLELVLPVRVYDYPDRVVITAHTIPADTGPQTRQ